MADDPTIFKEELAKPFFFLNVTVAELNRQLLHGAPFSVVVRNVEKWPSSDNVDVNKIRLECSYLLADGKAIEQLMIVKRRRRPISIGETNSKSSHSAIIATLASSRERMATLTGGTLRGDANRSGVVESEFNYFFEKRPTEIFETIDELLKHAKLKPLLAHKWEEHSFTGPTTCAQCNRFIWGFYKQGYMCRVCLKPAHERCVPSILPMCPGVYMTKSERITAAIRKAWTKFDKNKSGALSFTELTRLGMTREEAALFFKAFDFNHDYRIQYKEFAKMVERDMLPCFRMFDQNDDGDIAFADLRTGFKEMGLNVSNNELIDLFASMDKNEDGIVTFDEFLEACFVSISLQAAVVALKM